jgi:hypothetical protein
MSSVVEDLTSVADALSAPAAEVETCKSDAHTRQCRTVLHLPAKTGDVGPKSCASQLFLLVIILLRTIIARPRRGHRIQGRQ